jgi:NDP-sugar pyrophosphorylase family protein
MNQQFLDSEDDAWLLTQDRESSRKLLFDTENQLVGWMNKAEEQFKWVNEEKSGVSTGSTTLNYNEMAFSGLHFFRSDLFAEFEVKRQSVIDLYLYLAKHNRIISKPIQPNYWFDLGKPEQLISAENYLNHLVK